MTVDRIKLSDEHGLPALCVEAGGTSRQGTVLTHQ